MATKSYENEGIQIETKDMRKKKRQRKTWNEMRIASKRNVKETGQLVKDRKG